MARAHFQRNGERRPAFNGVAADLLRVRVSSVTLETHHTMTEGHSHDGFPHTVWNLVHAVGADSAAGAAGAREAFCQAYWFPIYAYLRRTGHGSHDAQDLTQAFLVKLIDNGLLVRVQPGEVKFRSYLLTVLKHFLNDERKRAQAVKRGGGREFISLEAEAAESRYRIEVADDATPEMLFEQHLALAILSRALDQLRSQYAARGRSGLFEALRPCLAGSGLAVSHAEIGLEIGLSEGAVKVSVHRLRREFGRVLRAEVVRTVADPAEVDAELRRMIEVTARVSCGL